jgi:hypothetical protein
MTAQMVVGLYESKGYAQDARNRLHTEGMPLSDMALVVIHDAAPVPEAVREEELAALAVSPLILGEVEKTFASYLKNGETAVMVQVATPEDVEFVTDIMVLYDPLAIEVMAVDVRAMRRPREVK